MKAELVPTNGDPPIPIVKAITVVGRRGYCDVQLDDPGVSKRHCVFVRTDGLLVMRDLASTNGTKVNGQRVRSAHLLPNDKISLGGYKLRVYLGPDDVPSPSERLRSGSGGGVRSRGPAATPELGFPPPSLPELSALRPEEAPPEALIAEDDEDDLLDELALRSPADAGIGLDGPIEPRQERWAADLGSSRG